MFGGPLLEWPADRRSMAIRARSDNLSLDLPSQADTGSARDFTAVWAHKEALRQACVRMIGDAARAEDLVQDTFVSALKCHGRLREDQPVAPWLKTVARRRSIDELRGRERITLMAETPDMATVTGDDPAEHVLNQELVQALRRAIGELTPRERQLLLRQASYGLSLAELAAEEDTSIASVRSVLSRARQKLRSSLERGGVFGALPLPRYLAVLRERVGRWAAQFEPALPTVTGAGARIGEVVAAVVTAIAMLLTGGSAPSYPDGSLAMTGASSSYDTPPADGAAPAANLPDKGPGAIRGTSAPAGPPATTSTPGALPPEIGDKTLPYDWTETPENMFFQHLAASSDGETIVAAGAADQSLARPIMFRSDDGGASWHRIVQATVNDVDEMATVPYGEVFLPGDFPADPRIFVLSYGSLFRSDDEGRTFTLAAPGVGNVLPAPGFGVDDERFFIVGPTPGVYDTVKNETHHFPAMPGTTNSKSDVVLGPDYETTGEILVTGSKRPDPLTRVILVSSCTSSGCKERGTIPFDTDVELLRVSASPQKFIAWNPSVYTARTTDGAATWTSEPYFTAGFSRHSYYDAGDAVYLYGANLTGNTAPLYRSTDGGATWTAVGVGSLIHDGTAAIIVLPNGNIVVSGRPYGLFCSTDDGATWQSRCPSP